MFTLTLTASEVSALEMLSGRFAFAGLSVEVGENTFDEAEMLEWKLGVDGDEFLFPCVTDDLVSKLFDLYNEIV